MVIKNVSQTLLLKIPFSVSAVTNSIANRASKKSSLEKQNKPNSLHKHVIFNFHGMYHSISTDVFGPFIVCSDMW